MLNHLTMKRLRTVFAGRRPAWSGRAPAWWPQVPTWTALVSASALLSIFAGCSTTHYRESADKEVYAAIDQKTPEVAGMPQDFTIDAPATPPEIETLPTNQIIAEDLGDVAVREVNAYILSLEKALSIAFRYSRDYQNSKESLYLQALSLTLDRHEFDPIFFGAAAGEYSRTTRDEISNNALGAFLDNSPGVAAAIETLTGQPADLFIQSAEVIAEATAVTGADTTDLEIHNERSVSGTTVFGVDYLLKSGGRLALTLTSNFLRFLTGDPRESAVSVLSGTFVQPLLRGGGRAVTIENLTQAERDLLYQLRTFTRFRKVFAVRIAQEYYGVLSARDEVRNAYRGLDGARRNLARTQALYDESREPASAVGRSEQNVLSFESSWVNAIRRYRNQLDTLKITLGLPIEVNLILDVQELLALRERGLIHPLMSEYEATEIALATRLDLYNQRDSVEDSERKVRVAANALLPGLDLIVDGQVRSKDGNRPFSPDWDRAMWSAGLDLDLPFDRKAERNVYRASIINHERSIRDYSLFEDNIRLDVRDALRALEQQRRQYDISVKGVEINERRVEEEELKQELGRGNANDLIDAQNDYIDAENSLTNALVSHTIGRLVFFRDLGILYVKDDGQWEEVN